MPGRCNNSHNMSKRRNTHALKRFTNRVKQIRRAHPGKSFRAAQKQASAELKKKPVKRIKPAKKAARVVARLRKAGKAYHRKVSNVGSRISKHVREAKTLLQQQLGVAEVQRYVSTNRKAYHRATKKAKDIKARLRRLL